MNDTPSSPTFPMKIMKMVECTTHYGKKKLIPVDKLTFRPSVYGIVVNDGNVLLLNTIHTGTYSLPGGGIEIGEPIEYALNREIREETGIDIESFHFFRFKEQFFYYDPADVAVHSFMFFYLCKPKTIELCKDNEVEDNEVEDNAVEKPRWVEIKGLEQRHFHNHGHLVVEALLLLKGDQEWYSPK